MDIIKRSKNFDDYMMFLNDVVANNDKADTSIIIQNELGEIIHQDLHNKVVVTGSGFTMMKHYNKNCPVVLPTYNNALRLDESVNEVYGEPGVRRSEQICLFAVGIDGCGPEAHMVYPVTDKSWISPANLIPFRVQSAGDDLTPLERTKYFGRKTVGSDIYYYFKAFDTDPDIVMRFVDGTPIDSNIFTSTNTLDIEKFVQLKLRVSIDDCREYFRLTTGMDTARINTVSLLTAYPTVKDGITYYQDIRPMTKLNFPNESLIQETKALDITYITYY